MVRGIATGTWFPLGAQLFLAGVLGVVAAMADRFLLGGTQGPEPIESVRAAQPVDSPRRRALVSKASIPEDSKEFAAALLNGMVEQIVHERGMIEARGQEPVVVRLAPQIPIRPEAPQAWLGGRPRLPDGMAWPAVAGTPLTFVAQIHCAALPADLWEGLGPRTGWLAFFLHPETVRPMVLHFDEAGAMLRSAVAGVQPVFGPRRHDRRHPAPAHIATDGFPGWPVDLVAVRAGGSDPRVQGERSTLHHLYKAGYDLTDPAHQPFDWPSTLEMLDVLARRAEPLWSPTPPGPSRLDWYLYSATKHLAAAEAASTPPDNLEELRSRVASLPLVIAGVIEAREVNAGIAEIVASIIADARARAAIAPFAVEEVAAIVGRLHEVIWARLLRKRDPEGGRFAELIEVVRLPLTRHDADADLWVHEFETLLEDWARHRYCDDVESLTPAARAHYEQIWRETASHDMAGMGHVPFRYVHEFDEADEVTLLELPSSNLMGWMFGDVDNLVLTMTKRDLAAGVFDRVAMQVSN
jgi:hypothetical protein